MREYFVATPIATWHSLLLTWVCARRPPAARRDLWRNPLTGTLPTELGNLYLLGHLCVHRGGCDAHLGGGSRVLCVCVRVCAQCFSAENDT